MAVTEYDSPLIDVSDMTLDDLGGLPDTALTAALREVMSDTAAPVSAGFSSSLRR